MIRRPTLRLVCAILATICLASPLAAQESEVTLRHEGEALKEPVRIPNNNGVYKDLDKLPESVRRSKIFAREMHRAKHRVMNESEYNPANRIAEFEFSQKQLIEQARANAKSKGDRSPLANAWTNVGPTGSTTTGGMTSAIVINPRKPTTMYAGAGGGGVWKSYNSGSNWIPLTDNVIPDLAVQSIAMDPVDTNTLYVGTGNAFNSVRDLDGSGVYKTTDGGATWARVGATALKGNIAKVFVHPKQTNIVFASGFDDTRGIFRSTDRGATWTKTYNPSSGLVWDIVPGLTINNDVTMYMVHGGTNGTGNAAYGIYKSVNNGTSWSKLTSGLPAGTTIGKAALAVSPKAPNKVWALIANGVGDFNGLYRTTDGQNFSSVSTAPTSVFKPVGLENPQGWYDLSIGVSPNSPGTNKDTVIIQGIEAHYSHDNGANWVPFSGYSDVPSGSPHVDHHSIAFHPGSSQRVYVGTDGGIYLSTNGGKNWSTRVKDYITHRYYKVGLQKNDVKISWTGAQDQGVWKHTTGSGSVYSGLGDGFQVAVHPQDANEVYAIGPNGAVYRRKSSSSFLPVGDADFNDGADWDSPFEITTKSPYIRYVGRQNLWKSTDGATWTKTITSPTGFDGGNPIRTIGINPDYNDYIWVGGYKKVGLTTNAGLTWTDRSSSLPSLVTSVQTPGGFDNRDFAVISLTSNSTTSARVMKTTNGGVNWTNASGSTAAARLPGVTCWAIALDSANPRSIWYAATDNGMYYTTDGGVKWSIAGSGIGLAPCWDVAVSPANKTTIRVATFGRGIWEANSNVLPVEISSLRAIPRDLHTELIWTTDSEHNSESFVVRRSFNYGEFEEIGSVAAAGTSNTRRTYAFNDPLVDTGYYIYQLRMIDLDGSESFSNTVEVHRNDGLDRLRLDQNFPNPFVPSKQANSSPTRIRYYLPKSDHVTMKLFNSLGQVIHTLVDGQQEAGQNDVFWNGFDNEGREVSAGTYFYMIETGSGEQQWNKMMIVD